VIKSTEGNLPKLPTALPTEVKGLNISRVRARCGGTQGSAKCGVKGSVRYNPKEPKDAGVLNQQGENRRKHLITRSTDEKI